MPAWSLRAARTPTRSLLRSPRDVGRLLRVFALCLRAPRLARRPLPELLPRLEPPPPPRADERLAVQAVAFTLTYLRLRRHPNACLVRGLTLFRFLRQAGVEADIHFGIDPTTRDGHCWISVSGEPLLEPTDPASRFLEMLRYPPRPAEGGGERA